MGVKHRYNFDKSSKKHHCPSCTKKRFVRYIDKNTGEYLPILYGRCDRERKCAYYLNPYTDGYAKAIEQQEKGLQTSWTLRPVKKVKKVNVQNKLYLIPDEVLRKTLTDYDKNVFIQNLLSRVAFPFETKDIEKVVSLYRLGTIKKGYRSSGITFPFIDVNNKVRTVQVKKFDEQNHTTGTDFLHSMLSKHYQQQSKPLPDWLNDYNKNETKVSCLFGEHLLNKYPYNPIALVEAPKTAIYGSLYFGFPDDPKNLLWLAVYNLSSLNLNKCQALKGRNVYLFPDLSKDGKAFDLWNDRANNIQPKVKGSTFQVSDLLEQLAPQQDKEQGKDIADYLIKQDWRLFRGKNNKERVSIGTVEKEAENLRIPKIEKDTITTAKGYSSEKGEKCERSKQTLFFPSLNLYVILKS